MRQIRASDIAPVPWRNGGGLTRELLAWPSTDDWRLRLSMADIAQDGPFSAFPGVTRAFVVLEGQGVSLDFPQGKQIVRPGDAPLRFDGGTAPHCQLLGGPVRDFNLMVRGGHGGLQNASASPWRPPANSLAGLLTRVAGTWRAGPLFLELEAHTLLWPDRGSEAWSFHAHHPMPETVAGWWFYHEETNA